jgi:hypothetical protein
MWRRLLNLATAVSMVLCLATAVLWVRSYWIYDELSWNQRSRQGASGTNWSVSAGSNCGQLLSHLQWYTEAVTLPHVWPPDGTTIRAHAWITQPASANAARVAHFGFYAGAIVRPDLVSRALHVPHWFVCAATAAIPVWGVFRRWRNRPQRGTCPVCGYDLRATPERCPECGTVTERDARAAA